VFHPIGSLEKLKKEQTGADQSAFGGCVASQEGQAIIDRAPFVIWSFGRKTLHRLPANDYRGTDEG